MNEIQTNHPESVSMIIGKSSSSGPFPPPAKKDIPKNQLDFIKKHTAEKKMREEVAKELKGLGLSDAAVKFLTGKDVTKSPKPVPPAKKT